MPQGLRGASTIRHLEEACPSPRCDGNDPLAAPTCSGPHGGANDAKVQRRSSGHRHFLQLSPFEKSYPLAIGREEWVNCSVGAGEWISRQTIHCAQITLLDTTLTCNIYEVCAVRREGQGKATFQAR